MKTIKFSHWRAVIFLLMLIFVISSWAYDFNVNGIFYDINGNNATVTYEYGSENCYSGSVTIPETVTYNGKTYSVTSIGRKAFYKCTDLTSVSIPNSVTSIGEMAFPACTALTSVIISNSVTEIRGYAFRDCTGLKLVTNLALTPQSIGNYVFSNVDLGECVLCVPEESVEAYKIADGWKEFGKILPIETTAINSISADADSAEEYYNLQGVRVIGELAPGIYIKRVGTKTEKVLIK